MLTKLYDNIICLSERYVALRNQALLYNFSILQYMQIYATSRRISVKGLIFYLGNVSGRD